jgi:hypothetical protein
MPVCPACETDVGEGLPACPKCGLATELFDPIEEAVGLPRTDPRYHASIHEILEAIGALPSDPSAGPAPAELANAARFPSTPIPETRITPPHRTVPVPERPKLTAAAGLPALRQQVAELLELARRRGLDVATFEGRAEALAVVDDMTELEQLDRDLFVHLAASLSGELEQLSARHREIIRVLPPTSLDAEMEKARTTLASGDLAGAQRELRRASITLEAVAAEWQSVETLVTEGELLQQAVTEFGGDPTPATGELDEGRRLAREGQRTPAEEILTKATLDLWAIAKPLLEADLSQRMETVLRLRAAGVDVRPILLDLKEFGVHLKTRNFPAAIEMYRRAGRRLEEVERARTAGAPGPDAAVKSSPKHPAA